MRADVLGPVDVRIGVAQSELKDLPGRGPDPGVDGSVIDHANVMRHPSQEADVGTGVASSGLWRGHDGSGGAERQRRRNENDRDSRPGHRGLLRGRDGVAHAPGEARDDEAKAGEGQIDGDDQTKHPESSLGPSEEHH